VKAGLFINALFGLSICGLFAGCDVRKAAESPDCTDLTKITDPARKAELAKRCPRGGPVFKPSEKKQW
jgi:entry exclusion lipoprotein TrbK